MITLSDLLSRRELGVRLASPVADPSGVEILHAEVCDLPDPRPWLEAGTILLTTGVGVGHGAHTQRLFVERAAQADVAAIGFAVGLAHADIPPAVGDAARRLEIPLLAVPPGTPFRLLIAAVDEQSAPFQLHVAQRGLSIQSYLMEAVGADEPEAEVLRRLGSLLSATAFIADQSGAIDGASPAAMPDELWGPLRGSRGVGLHHLRERRYVTAPISTRAELRRWIVVVGDPAALPDRLARQALQAGERLMRLIDRARPPRPAEARAIRRELVDQLLGFRTPPERRLLAGRLAALGLDVARGMRVALVCPAPSGSAETGSQVAAGVLAELEGRLSLRGVPFLLTYRSEGVIVAAGSSLAELLAEIGPDLPRQAAPASCGIGRVVRDLDHLGRSLADARFAVEQLRARPEPDQPGWQALSYEDLDLATALVCDGDPEVLESRGEALMRRISGRELRQTLLAYLDNDLDIPRTATALHLHANSLRYRLARIEEQLGMGLRHPSTIANLYLAVLSRRSGARDGDVAEDAEDDAE